MQRSHRHRRQNRHRTPVRRRLIKCFPFVAARRVASTGVREVFNVCAGGVKHDSVHGVSVATATAAAALPLTSTGQNEERASSTYTAARRAPIDGGDGRNYCTTCHRTNVSFEKGCSAADRVHTNAKCCLRANICKCSPSGPPRVWLRQLVARGTILRI